jgi:hypothetical protein
MCSLHGKCLIGGESGFFKKLRGQGSAPAFPVALAVHFESLLATPLRWFAKHVNWLIAIQAVEAEALADGAPFDLCFRSMRSRFSFPKGRTLLKHRHPSARLFGSLASSPLIGQDPSRIGGRNLTRPSELLRYLPLPTENSPAAVDSFTKRWAPQEPCLNVNPQAISAPYSESSPLLLAGCVSLFVQNRH